MSAALVKGDEDAWDVVKQGAKQKVHDEVPQFDAEVNCAALRQLYTADGAFAGALDDEQVIATVPVQKLHAVIDTDEDEVWLDATGTPVPTDVAIDWDLEDETDLSISAQDGALDPRTLTHGREWRGPRRPCGPGAGRPGGGREGAEAAGAQTQQTRPGCAAGAPRQAA